MGTTSGTDPGGIPVLFQRSCELHIIRTPLPQPLRGPPAACRLTALRVVVVNPGLGFSSHALPDATLCIDLALGRGQEG